MSLLNSPIIEFKNVSKNFSSSQNSQFVIHDISFSINREEFVCLLGPSGAGKTTILNLIAGFYKPCSGDVLFNGENIKRPGSKRAMVFQDYALFPWLNVLDNVAFGLTTKKNISKEDAKAKALSYLDLVGLKNCSHYSISSLSGGMKQRVAIARALCVEPEMLLLDEPFGALDQNTRQLMQNELVRIWSKSKKTIVFITHSVDEALLLADRVILLGGKPGSVLLDLKLDLDRPRHSNDTQLNRAREQIINKMNQPDQFMGSDI